MADSEGAGVEAVGLSVDRPRETKWSNGTDGAGETEWGVGLSMQGLGLRGVG